MTTIKIKGMSCNHCAMAVTKALSAVAGISDIQVDLKKGEATFTETKPVGREVVREAITKAGYETD